MTAEVQTPQDFRDSVVLITGAAGGIGRAAAKAFAEHGARLALVDANKAALADVRDSLGATGAPSEAVLTFNADVSDEVEVRGYFDSIVAEFGALDVVFNNAGVAGAVAATDEYGLDEFDKIMRVNVRGVFLNIKYGVLAMKRTSRRGSIVNTGSAVSLVGAPNLAPYTASKHAVLGLTKSAALELAESGIRVNAVCPGPTDTRMQHGIEDGMDLTTEQAHELVMKLIPMRRYGTPAEIAEVVLFLASERSAFITGAAISVDGAMTTG